MLGFQSGPGAGRTRGPAADERVVSASSSWTRLAARQVAAELGRRDGVVLGVGDLQRRRGRDPDKPAAACVYLWARDPALCDGPGAAGPDFDPSRAEGQIALPQGAQCSLDGRLLRQTDLSRVTAVTHDREVAFTVLYDRLVESGLAKVPAGRAQRRRSRRSSTVSSRAAARRTALRWRGPVRTPSWHGRRLPTSSFVPRSRARCPCPRRPSRPSSSSTRPAP